jgi:hypothetical protein
MVDPTELRITAVFAFENGQVMVFDQYGKQMPDYQGSKEEVWEAIMRDKTDATEIHEDVVWRPTT